jgi:hypothetical protein
MRKLEMFTAGAALAIATSLTLAMSHGASAHVFPFLSPAKLKTSCAAAGGQYGIAGNGSVHVCQLGGGAVIACGGQGPYAKTCESNAAERTIRNPILIRAGVPAFDSN